MIEPRDIQLYQRWLRAMLRRIADEDPEGMAAMQSLLRSAAEAVPLAVGISKHRQGWAYSELARGFGTTKQAAQERFSPYVQLVAAAEAGDLLELLAARVTEDGGRDGS